MTDSTAAALERIAAIVGPRGVLSPDDAALALMRTLKHAVDPLGIMNPGKIL